MRRPAGARRLRAARAGRDDQGAGGARAGRAVLRRGLAGAAASSAPGRRLHWKAGLVGAAIAASPWFIWMYAPSATRSSRATCSPAISITSRSPNRFRRAISHAFYLRAFAGGFFPWSAIALARLVELSGAARRSPSAEEKLLWLWIAGRHRLLQRSRDSSSITTSSRPLPRSVSSPQRPGTTRPPARSPDARAARWSRWARRSARRRRDVHERLHVRARSRAAAGRDDAADGAGRGRGRDAGAVGESGVAAAEQANRPDRLAAGHLCGAGRRRDADAGAGPPDRAHRARAARPLAARRARGDLRPSSSGAPACAITPSGRWRGSLRGKTSRGFSAIRGRVT